MPIIPADSNPFAAPRTPLASPPAKGSEKGLFERDRYLLKQKILAITERYKVFGEDGEVLLHVRRPARVFANLLAIGVMVGGVILAIILGIAAGHGIGGGGGAVAGVILGIILGIGAVAAGIAISPLRHLAFCTDEGYKQVLLTVSQDNKLAFPVARYSLRDAAGTLVCRFRKNVLWNLFRRRWYIDGPDGDLHWLVKEDSLLKSILRRIAPDLIAVFMRTNFVYLAPDSGQPVGIFNRKFSIGDNYVLDLSQDAGRRLDRRIALAMGVLLDTGEKR